MIPLNSTICNQLALFQGGEAVRGEEQAERETCRDANTRLYHHT